MRMRMHLRVRMHRRMRMHMRMHLRMHRRMHLCMHRRTHRRMHRRMHLYMVTSLNEYGYTCPSRTSPLLHMRVRISILIRTCIYARTRMRMCMRMCMRMRMRMRTVILDTYAASERMRISVLHGRATARACSQGISVDCGARARLWPMRM